MLGTKRGFSLIELITVVAIIVIAMSMMMPAISGFTSTLGRRGAVNSLMNAFEQARVAALETGCKVYVVMRRNANLGEPDSFVMMRERSDALGDGTNAFVPLNRWQKLPNGVLFYQAPGSLTEKGTSIPSGLADLLPGTPPSTELFGLAFNARGQVTFPGSGDLWLLLAEASRQASETAIKRGASISVTERLSFRRYTGRAQLDYTAPPQT